MGSWIPDVERWRRVLACAAVLLFLGLHGLARSGPLRSVLDAAVAPLAAVILPPAAALAGTLTPPAAAPEAPVPASLVTAERRLGRPPEGAGVAWLEVPVVDSRQEEGILVLAAGSRMGVAPGLPVVFGRHWLGRVLTAAPDRAEVLLWTAPDARTGVRLVDPEGNGLRGVAQGRRAGRPPVVAWLEGEPWARPGMAVLWRAREEDPPALEACGFSLGVLARVGDRSRGETLWVVEGELPAGAEGRVWVGAGARADRLVADPPVASTPARAILPQDAVLGRRLCQVEAAAPGPAAVALRAGRVLGPVVVRRGPWLWVQPLPPRAWREQAVALDPDRPRLLASAASAALQLYTRGGGGIPRGLWLGPAGAATLPPPPPEAAVEVVGRRREVLP